MKKLNSIKAYNSEIGKHYFVLSTEYTLNSTKVVEDFFKSKLFEANDDSHNLEVVGSELDLFGGTNTLSLYIDDICKDCANTILQGDLRFSISDVRDSSKELHWLPFLMAIVFIDKNGESLLNNVSTFAIEESIHEHLYLPEDDKSRIPLTIVIKDARSFRPIAKRHISLDSESSSRVIHAVNNQWKCRNNDFNATCMAEV